MKDAFLCNVPLVLFLEVLLSLTLFGKQKAWAQAESSMSRGVQLFKAYEFSKAEKQLRKALRGKLTKKQKAQAWVLISLSQYNQAQLRESKRSFQKALTFDRNVQIPKGQAPQVGALYEAMRKAWHQQHPQPRARPQPVKHTKLVKQPTIRQPTLARTPPPKTKTSTPTSGVKSKNVQQSNKPKRTTTGQNLVASSGSNLVKRKLPPVQPSTFWSRYGVSTVLIGVGVVGLGVGSGVAALSVERNQKVEELGTNPLVSGQQAESMYQQAQAAWIGSIVTFVASGVCLLTGASLALANLARSRTTPPASSRLSPSQTLLTY